MAVSRGRPFDRCGHRSHLQRRIRRQTGGFSAGRWRATSNGSTTGRPATFWTRSNCTSNSPPRVGSACSQPVEAMWRGDQTDFSRRARRWVSSSLLSEPDEPSTPRAHETMRRLAEGQRAARKQGKPGAPRWLYRASRATRQGEPPASKWCVASNIGLRGPRCRTRRDLRPPGRRGNRTSRTRRVDDCSRCLRDVQGSQT